MKRFVQPQNLIVLFSLVIFSACSKSSSNPPPSNGNSQTIAISSLSVNSGPYTTVVTITGTGFSTTASDDQVTFNGHAADIWAAGTTELQVVVPLAAGTGNIKVTVNGKTVTGPVFTYLPTDVVTNFAGSSQFGSADGVGAAATFFQPNGVAIDAADNLYVADTDNNLIRKITPDGTVSTLAGSTQGYVDGNGTAAKFDRPTGIVVDAFGNLYISDTQNRRIRKITPSGQVSTLAGNSSSQAVDGTGTAASFSRPLGLALDGSGNLYVADQGAGYIRKITPMGVVTTVYGGTSLDPYQLALDKAGNIYVASESDNDIIEITPNGALSVFAGNSNIIGGSLDGTGKAAGFYYPSGLTIDANGNLLVIDGGNGLIRKITPVAVVTTVGGRDPINLYGPVTTANFMGVQGIVADATGNIFFTTDNEIRKISVQ